MVGSLILGTDRESSKESSMDYKLGEKGGSMARTGKIGGPG